MISKARMVGETTSLPNVWMSINAKMQRIRRHLMEGNNDNPEMVLVQALGALSKHDTETVTILAKRLLERYP